MRLVKIPANGDEGGLDHGRIRQAEVKFLESLQNEVLGPVKPRRTGRAVKVAPRRARASAAAGRGLGKAYAALNGTMGRVRDLDRIASFAGAIKAGVDDAARRDAREAELTRDPDFLRSMGFNGFGPQFDDLY